MRGDFVNACWNVSGLHNFKELRRIYILLGQHPLSSTLVLSCLRFEMFLRFNIGNPRVAGALFVKRFFVWPVFLGLGLFSSGLDTFGIAWCGSYCKSLKFKQNASFYESILSIFWIKNFLNLFLETSLPRV